MMKIFATSAFCATVLVGFTGGASAQTTLDTSLSSPGVYFGNDNPNGNFAVTDATVGANGSFEMGLRADIRGGALIDPGAGSSTYWVPAGDIGGGLATWDFVFSAATTLGDLPTLSIAITDLTTGAIYPAFNPADPSVIPDNSHPSAGSDFVGIQNAENFGFAGASFDPNALDSYQIVMSASGGGLDSPVSDTITVNVPEPASFALLGVGLVGLGAMRRKRRA